MKITKTTFAWSVFTLGFFILSINSLRAQTNLTYDSEFKTLPANVKFGDAIAVDGNRIVTSSEDSCNGHDAGSVYVYEWDGTQWNETKLKSSIGYPIPDNFTKNQFGHKVDIQGDRIVIASPLEIAPEAKGVVYIYDYDGTNWVESKISAPNGMMQDYFGTDIALDNDRIAVGAFGADPNGNLSGTAYVFEWDGSQWNSQELLPPSIGTFDFYGKSIALLGDQIVVGMEDDDDLVQNGGSAFLWEYNGTQWIETYKFVASDFSQNASFGQSVSISPNSIVIGAFNDATTYNGAGSIYHYEFDGSNWNETKITASDATQYDNFGYSVSHLDNQILVGARFDYDSGTNGSIYIFDWDGTQWNETKFLCPDFDYWQFGTSIDLQQDHFVAAAPDSDNPPGGIITSYKFDGTSWNSEIIQAQDLRAWDAFATAVDIDGDCFIANAQYDSEINPYEGAAYIYKDSGGSWSQTKIVPDGTNADESYGFDVAIEGNIAVVGSKFASTAGLVYIYEWDGSQWVETTITPANVTNSAQFGFSVSIESGKIVIGAPYDNNSQGAVILLEKVAGSWTQTKITASDATNGDRFGSKADISGNRIIAGAPLNDDQGSQSGSGYIFDWNGSSWNETKVVPSYLNSNDKFPTGLAVDGNLIAFSCSQNDYNGFADAGVIEVLEWNGSGYSATTITDTPQSGAFLGYSVDVKGNLLLTGNVTDFGTSTIDPIYLFEKINGSWIRTTYQEPNNVNLTRIGHDVSLSSDYALIGSFNKNGSAYLYNINAPTNNCNDSLAYYPLYFQPYSTISTMNASSFVGSATGSTGPTNNGSINWGFGFDSPVFEIEDYLEFTLTDNTNNFDAKSISMDLRGGFDEATDWSIRSSIDGYTTDLGTGGGLDYFFEKIFVELPSNHENLSTVTFRLYGWGGIGNFPRLYFDNVLVSCNPAICDDGIMNQDETGIDCGGNSCPACDPCAIENIIVTNQSCNGQNDGEIIFELANGCAPNITVDYDNGQWSSSQTFGIEPYNIIYLQGPYTYNITVTDENGSSMTTSVFVDVDYIVDFDVNVNGTDAVISDLNGNSSGPYSITLYDSFYNFIVSYSSASLPYTISGLTPDTYNIDIYDTNGCNDFEQFTIAQPMSCTTTISNESCLAYADGSITVSVTGGLSPFTYSIDGTNFQTGNIFGNLPVGSYTMTVMDANGDTSSCSATVSTDPDNENPELYLTTGTYYLDANGSYTFSANDLIQTNGTGFGFNTVLNFPSDYLLYFDHGDIDGDGDLDIVAHNRIYENDGAGNFVNTYYLDYTDEQSRFFDADGDGDLDLYIILDQQADKLYFNDGTGNFTDSGYAGPVETDDRFAIGDIDNDGDLDVVSMGDGAFVSSWVNDGTGQFTHFQLVGGNNTQGLDLGDVDGDGDLDVLLISYSWVRVYPNDGSGNFSYSSTNIYPIGGNRGSLFDIDSDNDLDIFVMDIFGDHTIIFNDGLGNFTLTTQQLGTQYAYDHSISDLDSDGDEDIILYEATNIKMYVNDGLGTIEDSIIINHPSLSGIVGDYNGDGLPDITTFEQNNYDNKVLLNTSSYGTTDNCDTNLDFSYNPSTLDCTHLGTTTVTVSATDDAGNSTTETIDITVIDDLPPLVICQDIQLSLDGMGTGIINASSVIQNSFDNCGIVNSSVNITSFDCNTLGSNTVTVTVEDASGAMTSCPADVFVEDNTAPSLICQNITVNLDATGTVMITENDLIASASDNCINYTASINKSTFNCNELGVNDVIVTATDDSNNSNSCLAKVTVVDNILPTVLCTNLTVSLDANGAAIISANDLDLGSYDNCGIANMTINKSNFSCTDIGQQMVTLTISDLAGNFNSCTATVTVVDILGACCPLNLTESNNPITDDIYQAQQTITSAGVVPANGNVEFGATTICLDGGFEVKVGATFEARIDPCIP